jgi:UDP-N-acetylmuramate--alanine ligase
VALQAGLTDHYMRGAFYPEGGGQVIAARLVEAIRAHGHRDAHFIADLDGVLDRLAAIAEPGDLVITLGAGSIGSVGPKVLAALAARAADAGEAR